MKKSKAYIAGPITSIPGNIAEMKFTQARLILKLYGYDVIDPYLLNKGIKRTWLGYMIVDFLFLIKCDTIYMLRGWKQSKGAKIERFIAQILRMQIKYQEIHSIPIVLKSPKCRNNQIQ